MAIEGGAQAPVHDLDRGLALLAQGAALLLSARTWSRSQEEVRAAIAAVTALAGRREAGGLGLLRASAGLDEGSGPGPETRQWMVWSCGPRWGGRGRTWTTPPWSTPSGGRCGVGGGAGRR